MCMHLIELSRFLLTQCPFFSFHLITTLMAWTPFTYARAHSRRHCSLENHWPNLFLLHLGRRQWLDYFQGNGKFKWPSAILAFHAHHRLISTSSYVGRLPYPSQPASQPEHSDESFSFSESRHKQWDGNNIGISNHCLDLFTKYPRM